MKVAINGFGRIGRCVFKIAFDRGMDIIAINDVHGAKDAAYLLKYDSIYGPYGKKIEIKGDNLVVGGKKIRILQERDPAKLPWKKFGVDIVVEATGAFREKGKAAAHCKAGARYVFVTAPVHDMKDSVVLGVNDEILNKYEKVFSVASCTTNCLAPMLKVLDDNFGIENVSFTTVHAYTSSQSLVDSSHEKPSRGRAAALNIVTTTTGASNAIVGIMPHLKGKIEGMAMRVPVAAGSITDVVAQVKKKATIERVNAAFKKAAASNMKGILEYSEELLVSSDIIRNTHSVIFDSLDTKVSGDLVMILGWYDNEWGYSARVVDVMQLISKKIK